MVVTVPDSAVLDDGATQVVFVERGPAAISPGMSLSAAWRRHGEVTSGIAAGEKVVVAPFPD